MFIHHTTKQTQPFKKKHVVKLYQTDITVHVPVETVINQSLRLNRKVLRLAPIMRLKDLVIVRLLDLVTPWHLTGCSNRCLMSDDYFYDLQTESNLTSVYHTHDHMISM